MAIGNGEWGGNAGAREEFSTTHTSDMSPLCSHMHLLPFSSRFTDPTVAHSLMSPALQVRNTCSHPIHRRKLKHHSFSKHSVKAGFVPGPVGV